MTWHIRDIKKSGRYTGRKVRIIKDFAELK